MSRQGWQTKAKAGDWAGALVDFIEWKNGRVSFAEITRAFADYMPVDGDATIRLNGQIILWTGLSDELAGLITTLMAQECICWCPTSKLVYMCHGKTLDLPVWPLGPRSAAQWMPVVFDLASG